MIFLGIGSNLHSSFGDRFENINLAIDYLKRKNIKLIKKSSFYETLSYPNKNDPKFINVIISIETTLLPEELMTNLLDIEKKLERKREKKNQPRTCDIDIIDYKGKIIELKSSNLNITIPHKYMTERNFVLYPLKEICPNWTHPLTKKNIDILIKDLKTSNIDITKLDQNDINRHVK